MSVVVVLIVINLIIAAIPATIATNKDKNRSFGLWYIYGFFLFLIALIHSLCISNRNELEPEIIKTNTLKNQSFLIDLYSPVLVLAYEIIQIDKTFYLKLDLKNLAGTMIDSIKGNYEAYDSFNELISADEGEKHNFIIQDMALLPGYHKIFQVPLLSENIRRIDSFSVTQVKYAQENIQHINQHLFEMYGGEEIPKDYLKAAQSLLSSAKYYPQLTANGWICTCGYPNLDSNTCCANCKTLKGEVFSKIQEGNLIKSCSNIKKKNKSLLIISIGAISLIVVALIIIALHYNQQEQKREDVYDELAIMDKYTKYIGISMDYNDGAIEELQSLLSDTANNLEIFGIPCVVDLYYDTDTEIINRTLFYSKEEVSNQDFNDMIKNISFVLGEPEEKEITEDSNDDISYCWANYATDTLMDVSDDYNIVSNADYITLTISKNSEDNTIEFSWTEDVE